jgi:RimJ/RimL family protein N-acetyltransferase
MGIALDDQNSGICSMIDVKEILLRPADPQRDFSSMAALYSSFETEPTTPQSLLEWYHNRLEHGIRLTVALTPEGKLAGLSSIHRDNLNLPKHFGLNLIIKEEFRGHGLGSRMYGELVDQAGMWNARTLRTRVRDNSNESLGFALHRGFVQKKHSIEMKFNLRQWDDARYQPVLQSLQAQGFHFTNMAELGDTVEMRRNLYELNSRVAATDPGSDGISPWASFEEFNQSVCNSSWYRPEGQIVAIDSRTGDWAAMSAITVFGGSDHAYNLFTGTDVRYRGQKLAQAVKSLALRQARTFGVDYVRTNHDSENAAMIAIDTKLGYKRTPGMLILEKTVDQS